MVIKKAYHTKPTKQESPIPVHLINEWQTANQQDNYGYFSWEKSVVSMQKRQRGR